MLRDLKTGATIHILNRKENTISQAEVVQITAPAPQFNLQVTPQGVMPPRHVLSMRLRWNGRDVVFNNLFADQSSAECSDGSGIVVCQDDASLLNELKSSKSNVDYLVSNHDNFVKQSKWYEEQIAMRDPAKQAEIETAKQVEAIKSQFNDILAEQNAKIDQLTQLLQSALNNGSGKKGKD